MLDIRLNDSTVNLRRDIQEMLNRADVSDVVIEVGPNQTRFGDNVIYIDTNICETQEDVLALVALRLHNQNIHNKAPSFPTVLWLENKYGRRDASKIGSVIESSMEPGAFFQLSRYRV